MGQRLFDNGKPDTDAPRHIGHRQRLRERFLVTGGEGIPDYELLELLLMLAVPRRDVKPLAKSLLDQFGDFASVISADREKLQRLPGMGDTTVTALKLAKVAAVRLLQIRAYKRDAVSSWQQLVDYCRAAMAHEQVEQLRLLFLDRKNMLIADEVQQRGTVDHAPLYVREVAKRALELGASALLVVHNHPSGDPTPSEGDIKITRDVQAALEKLGIVLHDHVVIGREDYRSFRNLGLL